MWTVLAIVLALLAATIVVGEWGARKKRRQHIAGHPAVSDGEYLEKIGLPQSKNDLCLAFRRAMADAAGIPPESVCPSDSLAHLCGLGFDGIDLCEILPFLERRLGVKISDREAETALAGKFSLQMPFGDFVRCYVENWASIAKQVAPST